MDYLEHFGLHTEPFSHAPVSQFYFNSQSHQEAERRLMHIASAMKGLAVLLAEIGHGKTTLARRVLHHLPEKEFEAAMLVIVHGGVTANWLLKRIALQLGVKDPGEDKLTIVSQLYQRLVQIHDEGRKAVVIIDEAQMLQSRSIMEEFRGLLNLEVPGSKLISFIFFGLPDLENNLLLDPPLAQRVAMRFRLQPLNVADTGQYVHHRMRTAGSNQEVFPPDSLEQIHRFSKGVPRVVNTIADNALLELFFAGEKIAGPKLILQVAENLGMTGESLLPIPADLGDAKAEPLAVEGAQGEDAIVSIEDVDRRGDGPSAIEDLQIQATAIAERVAREGNVVEEHADPLAFMESGIGLVDAVSDDGAADLDISSEDVEDVATAETSLDISVEDFELEPAFEPNLDELAEVELSHGDLEVDTGSHAIELETQVVSELSTRAHELPAATLVPEEDDDPFAEDDEELDIEIDDEIEVELEGEEDEPLPQMAAIPVAETKASSLPAVDVPPVPKVLAPVELPAIEDSTPKVASSDEYPSTPTKSSINFDEIDDLLADI